MSSFDIMTCHDSCRESFLQEEGMVDDNESTFVLSNSSGISFQAFAYLFVHALNKWNLAW